MTYSSSSVVTEKEKSHDCKDGLPVMAEITRILTAKIRRQFFFCYHHCSVYSLPGSKFSTNLLLAASKCQPNDWMVAVVKHCWLLEQEAAEKDD